MSLFPPNDFLLHSEVARELYFDYAAHQPIIDYHNHLPPQDIASDRRFANLTEAWLEDDHYKWRAMRTLGVPEVFCTGDAPPRDKFMQWAGVVPLTVGNPLYHWTHMELQNPFGIGELLNAESAEAIYDQANECLGRPEYSTRGLMTRRGVEVVCTTDEPFDALEHHRNYTPDEKNAVRLLPTYRIDSLLPDADGGAFNETLGRLEQACDAEIISFPDFMEVLKSRHDYFHQCGCRLSDVGISDFQFEPAPPELAARLFNRIRSGEEVTASDAGRLAACILLELAELNARRGWVQQLHIGAMRNAHSRKSIELGPGRGFDTIGSYNNGRQLRDFLDHLASRDRLAKTILYNLNPADNAVFSTLAGTFNEGDVRGKVQHGAAWWFLDQKQGIEEHLQSVSSLGILSCFVGMLTDSRSFLSFSRHEYFRRILCNFFGDQVEQGLLPRDIAHLGEIVSAISYGNAREYFPFYESTDGDQYVD
jgi:glucuronate isomerase